MISFYRVVSFLINLLPQRTISLSVPPELDAKSFCPSDPANGLWLPNSPIQSQPHSWGQLRRLPKLSENFLTYVCAAFLVALRIRDKVLGLQDTINSLILYQP